MCQVTSVDLILLRRQLVKKKMLKIDDYKKKSTS